MRILIAEDDAVCRKILLGFFSRYGECDLVVDGLEAMDAVLMAMKEKKAYDLLTLDIMIPKVDGVRVLKGIRELETRSGILPAKRTKVIVITALEYTGIVKSAFEIGCEAYAAKPIDMGKLVEIMENLGFSEKKSIG